MLQHLPAFGVSFVRIETSAYVWMLNMQVGAQALAKQSGALVGAGGDCSKISEVPFQQAWRGLIWWIRIRLLVIQQLPQLEWRFWYP